MKPLPRLAWILGYAGIIPFVVLGLAIALGKPLPFLAGTVRLDWWLVTYAALILSFLGAVNWGVVLGMQDKLSAKQTQLLLAYSVVPAVLAWFCFLLPVKSALLSMGNLLIGAYLADHFLLFPILQSQYRRLRYQLSFIVVAILFAVSTTMQ